MNIDEIIGVILIGIALVGALVLMFLCLFFEHRKEVRQSQWYITLTDEGKRLIDIYRSIK